MSSAPLLAQRSRTKIVATLGPASRKPEQIAELVAAGADVFRLNMAHADLDVHNETVRSIRRVSEELHTPLAILADLAGPKIRLGELDGGELDCVGGTELTFVRGETAAKPGQLVTTYEPLINELDVGNLVMLADGTVSLEVISKTANSATCRVVQPGLIRSRQGVNLPGVKLSAPSMDEDDIRHAKWAAETGIDFIGLSFVRQPNDVTQLKEMLKAAGSRARVIAKIEKPEAVDQLDAIIAVADGIMVARGDLGVEIDVARMPLVQKQIISTCRKHQKPVIVATQMLDSMQNNSRPTRAEVTDVANAILDGGDACMLSGETAIGKHPREAVAMMRRIARATEEMYRSRQPLASGERIAEGLHPVTNAVVQEAGLIASRLNAKLTVVASHTGATALAISKQRSYVPTVGVSDQPATLRQMCLYWGVIPLPDAPMDTSNELLAYIVRTALEGELVKPDDYMVLVAGIGLSSGSHDMVRVHRVSAGP